MKRGIYCLLICLVVCQIGIGQIPVNAMRVGHTHHSQLLPLAPSKTLASSNLPHLRLQKKTSFRKYEEFNLTSTLKKGYEDNQSHLSPYALTVPVIGIAYGFWALESDELIEINNSTRNEILEDQPHFLTNVDDYLQFSPAAAVIGLNLAGVKGKHSFLDELGVYAISTFMMFGTVQGIKQLTHERRPDGVGYNSFPSGHTATAFAAAEWLRAEYWDTSPSIGVAGYFLATATGTLRLYNNRHWVSDVVAGAAIGFLSTKIAYLLYPWIKQLFHSKRKKGMNKKKRYELY